MTRRTALKFVPLTLLLAFIMLAEELSGSTALASDISPPRSGPVAHYPNVDNVSVTQDCIANGNVRLSIAWTEYNLGPKWLDLSIFNNGWAFGTFLGLGPIPPGQASAVWDGLLPGLSHYIRVNTLTASGWQASQTVSFFTRSDCSSIASRPSRCQAVVTPPGNPGGPLIFMRPAFNGCVWTLRGDGATYGLGEPVTICYAVGAPVHIRIVITKPDGTSSVAAERDDDGTGGCLAPGTAALPRGPRTVSLFIGPSSGTVSETRYDVE